MNSVSVQMRLPFIARAGLFLLWSVGVFVTLFLLHLEETRQFGSGETIAHVLSTTGKLQYRQMDIPVWREAIARQSLENRSVIATESKSSARIAMRSGKVLEIGENTQIVLIESDNAKDGNLVTLLKGEVKTSVLKPEEKKFLEEKKSSNLFAAVSTFIEEAAPVKEVVLEAAGKKISLSETAPAAAISWKDTDAAPEVATGEKEVASVVLNAKAPEEAKPSEVAPAPTPEKNLLLEATQAGKWPEWDFGKNGTALWILKGTTKWSLEVGTPEETEELIPVLQMQRGSGQPLELRLARLSQQRWNAEMTLSDLQRFGWNVDDVGVAHLQLTLELGWTWRSPSGKQSTKYSSKRFSYQFRQLEKTKSPVLGLRFFNLNESATPRLVLKKTISEENLKKSTLFFPARQMDRFTVLMHRADWMELKGFEKIPEKGIVLIAKDAPALVVDVQTSKSDLGYLCRVLSCDLIFEGRTDAYLSRSELIAADARTQTLEQFYVLEGNDFSRIDAPVFFSITEAKELILRNKKRRFFLTPVRILYAK